MSENERLLTDEEFDEASDCSNNLLPVLIAQDAKTRAATLKEVGKIIDKAVEALSEKLKADKSFVGEWAQIEVLVGALLKGEFPDTGKEK